MLVVGNTTDQIAALIWGYLSSKPFTITDPLIADWPQYQTAMIGFVKPWLTNEPVSSLLISLMGSLLGPNGYNIYLFIVLLANFIIFYLVFKNYRFWWFGCLIFSLSSYYYLHLGIHPVLNHLYLLPVFYKLYVEQKYKVLPFFILLASLISNYIGFILIILLCTLVLSNLIFGLWENKQIYRTFYKDLVSILVTGLLIFLTLFRFFSYNYTKPEPTKFNDFVLNRSVSDFTIFSARPWYFLIPSHKNPLLGNFSIAATKKIDSMENYLFKQYFPEEHNALFFGFSFYLFLIYAVLSKRLNKRAKILCGISVLTIFVAMLPPEIVINGRTIYLPSYIIFKVFPVFRVTSRLAIAIHFLLIIFLMKFLQEYKISKNSVALVSLLAVLTLAETFIPIKIRRLSAPPEYKYIYENTDKNSLLSAYPYSKSRDALLWLPVHQRRLTNTPGIIATDFNSKDYTKNLFNSSQPLVTGYIIVDNANLTEVPLDFTLVRKFDSATLYFK